MKKLLTVILALALCAGLSVTAFAGGEPSAYGPSYIIDDLYYPLDEDDAGAGWSYSAATATLTIENFSCQSFGLYALYEPYDLYVNMVGDNNACAGDVSSICYAMMADEAGGDIFFTGEGSLTVGGSLSGRNFGFYGGTVSAAAISTPSYMESAITFYDGAALNVSNNGSGPLQSNSVVMYGGTLNITRTYSDLMSDSHSYAIHAGEINVVCTSTSDALRIQADTYAALLASGCVITSGDGGATIHDTSTGNDFIRLASDSGTALTSVRIVGAGEPVAAPEREPVEEPAKTPETPEPSLPAEPEETDPSRVFTDEQLWAGAEELGINLSEFSGEELEAILDEVAAVMGGTRDSGRTSEPEEPAPHIAYARAETVDIGGQKVELYAYGLMDENGSYTNYVKLRDIAYALDGTAAQFEVGWDGAINILTGQSYTANGTEMAVTFEGDHDYSPSDAVVKLNGAAVELEGICLTNEDGAGYNYYKLRDLGRALGFNVGWTAERGIFIEPDKPYTDAN